MSARVLIAIAVLIALAFALDFAIGRYQQYRLDQKRLAELRLQHAAYEGMFVEVVNVAYEPDQKSYRLTMKITNVEPGRPLYVMQSPVRVFEQTGLSWKEVPSRDPDGQSARVIKLADAHTFETIFEPNLAEWTELIPATCTSGSRANSLVSERSEPDDDIIDRTDRYYVYLKPHGADDNAIRKRMNYQRRSAGLHADAAALGRDGRNQRRLNRAALWYQIRRKVRIKRVHRFLIGGRNAKTDEAVRPHQDRFAWGHRQCRHRAP